MRLYLATVDFLDGATLAEYGAGLRDKWDLGEKDLLLLMAAGEDTFGFFGRGIGEREVLRRRHRKSC